MIKYAQVRIDSPNINCDQCDKLLEEDNIEPNCEKCPLPLICEENQLAFNLYMVLKSKFIREMSLTPLVFELFNIKCTREKAFELLEKLIILHEIFTEVEKSE